MTSWQLAPRFGTISARAVLLGRAILGPDAYEARPTMKLTAKQKRKYRRRAKLRQALRRQRKKG
jgi:hypothetical protein